MECALKSFMELDDNREAEEEKEREEERRGEGQAELGRSEVGKRPLRRLEMAWRRDIAEFTVACRR